MIGHAMLARIGGAAVIAALLVGFGWYQGGKSARADLNQEQASHRATKAHYTGILLKLRDLTAEAARKAKAASDAVKRDRAENDQRFEEKTHESDRTIADLQRRLRDGTVRLQPWWEAGASQHCPAAGAGDAAAVAGGQDGYADLRHADALANVRDADAADRWIEWLQFELVSTREALKAAGLAVEAMP